MTATSRAVPADPASPSGLVLRLEPTRPVASGAWRVAAAHGPPSVGERRLRRLIAGERLDSETRRRGGGKDQRDDDPDHRSVLLPTPAGLERPPTTVTGLARQSSGSRVPEEGLEPGPMLLRRREPAVPAAVRTRRGPGRQPPTHRCHH